MQSIHSCRCLEIETVFLKGLKLKGEKVLLGVVRGDFIFAIPIPLRSAAAIKLRFALI